MPTRRTACGAIVALGLFCLDLSETKLKHKEFGPWVEANCPDVSYRSIRAYMQLTRGVFEEAGIQIGSALPICRSGEILLLPDAEVSQEAKAIRDKVFDLVDGKSQRELLIRFRDPNGKRGGFRPDEKAVQKWLKKHHPDLAGTKFADLPKDIQKEFRADYERSKLTAKERAELEIQEAEEAVAQLIGDIELVVLKGDTMGLVSDETRKALLQKGEAMNAHLREIIKAAKGGKSK